MSSGYVNTNAYNQVSVMYRFLANAMFTYSAWTSVVFLLVTGIAKAYGSVKNK